MPAEGTHEHAGCEDPSEQQGLVGCEGVFEAEQYGHVPQVDAGADAPEVPERCAHPGRLTGAADAHHEPSPGGGCEQRAPEDDHVGEYPVVFFGRENQPPTGRGDGCNCKPEKEVTPILRQPATVHAVQLEQCKCNSHHEVVERAGQLGGIDHLNDRGLPQAAEPVLWRIGRPTK